MKKSVLKTKGTFFNNRMKVDEGVEQLIGEILLANEQEYRKKVERCREYYNEGNKPMYDKLKRILHCFMPSGTLNGTRKAANVINYTGLLLLDFDKLGKNLKKVRKKIEACEHTLFCMLSVSGDGLKVIVRVDSEIENHKVAFNQVKAFYEKLTKTEIDSSGSDVCRMSYYSADEKLFLNKKAKIFSVEIEEKPIEHPEAKKIITPIRTSKNKESVLEVLEYLTTNDKSITDTYYRWVRVGFALADAFDQEEAKGLFREFSKLDVDKYNEKDFNKQWRNCSKRDKEGNKITLATLFYFAKEEGFNLSGEQKEWNKFWHYTAVKEDVWKIEISHTGLLDFWFQNGFRAYKSGKNFILVKIKDNRIVTASLDEMKIILRDYVNRNVPYRLKHELTREDLLETVLRKNSMLFNKNTTGFLESVNEKEHWDIRDTAYFYFNNGLVSVTKDGIEILPYSDLKEVIWESKIISHNLKLDTPKKSDFEIFIGNVMGNDPKKILALETIMGYAMHRFKDATNARAVVMLDESSEKKGANGGTGKTLITNALSKIRKASTISGKKCDTKHRFALQGIAVDSDIIIIDDIKEDFDFNGLYPVITGDLKVERKGQNEFEIPFDRSGKFLITSNYLLNGATEGSTLRRVIEIELSHYYSHKFTPLDDFGKTFFSDQWSEEDFNNFYIYLLKCVKKYLKKGLVEYDKSDLVDKQLKNELGKEFVKFFKTEIEYNVEYDTGSLRRDYNKDYSLKVSQRDFHKMLETYIDLKEIDTDAYKRRKKKPWRESNGRYLLKLIE